MMAQAVGKPKKKPVAAVKPAGMSQAQWLQMQAMLAAQKMGSAVQSAGSEIGSDWQQGVTAARQLGQGAKDVLGLDQIRQNLGGK